MNTPFGASGEWVQITSYSPFRGLRGVIQRVQVVGDDDDDEPLSFYLVSLDTQKEPVWFENSEIEALDALSK
jgi:hypothetical protein